jgi:hypothetical protein
LIVWLPTAPRADDLASGTSHDRSCLLLSPPPTAWYVDRADGCGVPDVGDISTAADGRAAGVQLHARGLAGNLTGNSLRAVIVNTFLLLIAPLRYHGEEAG